MHRAFDWQPFVKQHWEKTPARLALPAPILPAEQVVQAAVSACAPFRHGTRFGALPDARFLVEAARLAVKRPHHSLVTLVLQGRLRVRLSKKLWGPPPNETEDFDRHLDKAATLKVGPGEFLYVPSRYWQLEEAQGN